MASQKQIDANRLNAQKSTGPRTASGKARSRLNALRDALTGQITTLSDKDRPLFERLKAELVAGFNPKNPMERKLAEAIAWDTWRLDHLRAIEMNIYALGILEESAEDIAEDPAGEIAEEIAAAPDDFDTALADARTFRAEGKRFDLMSLYETRMNRNLHRNLAILRDLQAERKRNYEAGKKEETQIARLHEFNNMPIQASAYPSKNGFIFSNEEIAVAAVRLRYADVAGTVIKNTYAGNLGGGLETGHGDEFLRMLRDKRRLTEQELHELYKTPPEVLAVQRLNNPADFGLKT
jgi:hypothetical protein